MEYIKSESTGAAPEDNEFASHALSPKLLPVCMTNPYEATTTTPIIGDVAHDRINSVSRIFVWIGLLGSLLYIPIVIGCLVSLVANLIGRPLSNPKIDTPWVIAFATVMNSAILAIWLTFVVTARQIKRRIYHVRTRALVLSVILTLGFPVLTIPGIMCFRWIRKFFHAGIADQLSTDENREQSNAHQALDRPF